MPPGSRAWRVVEEGTGLITASLARARTVATPAMRSFGPALFAPVPAPGGAVGVLILLRKVGAPPFEPSDLTTAASFAAQAALATQLAAGRHAHDLAALLDERERIARDLHDLAIQQLFATGLQLETVRRRAARGVDATELTAIVDEALDNVDGSVRQIRRIVHDLRDPDAATGLVERLRREASLARTGLGFAPSLRRQPRRRRRSSWAASTRTVLNDRVGPDLTADVVAVVREGLANAARHARASSVTVRVHVVGAAPQGSVRVEVEDDGVGLPADRRRSSGTRNLARTRPSSTGGPLEIGAPSDGPRHAADLGSPSEASTAQPPGSTRQPARARDATHAATWVRRCRPIFASTEVMWFFTVFSTMPEPFRDLPVGHPLADELDDAQLAGRQSVRRVVVPGLVPGDRPLVEQGPPGRDRADHLRDLRTPHRLQQVRGRTLVERGRQRVVVVERRQDDRPRLGQPLAQRAQELDPRAVRQLQVHEHDLRPHQVGAPHPVRHRAGLRDDRHALGAVHELRDAATDHLVVVDDHHGDGTRGGAG